MFKNFIHTLKQNLSKELPGQDAQYTMVSLERFRISVPEMDKLDARLAAVLILFYEQNNAPHLVFMQRNTYPGVHSNQISFPGGKHEQDDKDMITTALRESYEELRIVSHNVEVLGSLTKIYIPPSNFIVEPILGICKHRPDFIPDKNEVAEIIEIPFSHFMSEQSVQTVEVESTGHRHKVPAYVINGKVIWGATAMILAELVCIMQSRT